MCADERALDPEERRRRSREVVEGAVRDRGTTDRKAVIVMRAHSTWNEWLMYDFLRYWYGVGALAFAGLLVMAIAQEWHVKDAAGILGLAVLAAAVIAGEAMIYWRIWPQGPFTEEWAIRRNMRRLLRRLTRR